MVSVSKEVKKEKQKRKSQKRNTKKQWQMKQEPDEEPDFKWYMLQKKWGRKQVWSKRKHFKI